jgi:hypothetical protein
MRITRPAHQGNVRPPTQHKTKNIKRNLNDQSSCGQTKQTKGSAIVWKSITDAINMETAILNKQQKLHFSQAKDTPFTQEPLKNIFNWSGTSHQAERVLSRQFNLLYNITSQADQLLQHCYQNLPEASPEISLQAMNQKYRNWSEGSSTSPSGRHIGHKHALLRPWGLNPNGPDFEQLDTLCKTTWRIHHGMLNFGLRDGYCYNRWKTVFTTLIEKTLVTHIFPFKSFTYTKTATTSYLGSPIAMPSIVPKTPTHSTKATADPAPVGLPLTQLV